MAGPKIGVIGSLNVDYVAYVDNAPDKGETILANSFVIAPGGKGANQAFALGRIGADVAMFGMVGNDENGKLELDNLKKAGVDIEAVELCNDPTGLALITVSKNGDNRITVVAGANQKVDEGYIDRNFDKINECDVVIFQLEIPLKTVKYAADRLHKAGKTIILDPAPVPDDFPIELFSLADYIKPNETELAQLSGMSKDYFSIEKACVYLIERGANCILATAGPDGAFCMRKQERTLLHFPSYDVKVVDTVAAGDSFTASFAFGISNGLSFESSVKLAVEVSTIVVQRAGAQTSIPDKDEFLRIINDILTP